MKQNLLYWRGWLQGFGDGEAYVDPNAFRITVSNTDKSLLGKFQQGLELFDIHCRLLGPYHDKNPKHSPIYRLHIQRREAVRRWYALIGFSDQTKIDKLQALIDDINSRRRGQP